jgi:predicted PurR-regulated permease PerM
MSESTNRHSAAAMTHSTIPASREEPGTAGPAAGTGHTRRRRLNVAAAAHGVPLPTILVTVGVVGGTILLAQLAYRLRNVLLLIFMASFLALILNPLVLMLQDWGLRRRGQAVAVVVLAGAAAFIGLAFAFGHPLANGLTNLAHAAPTYVSDARHGHGVIGRLIERFHLQSWVDKNSPKLQELGANLAKPALSVGKGAVTIVGELLVVFTLVVLLLLEGPHMRKGLLALLSPERAAWCERVGTEIRRSVIGYVFGDLLTSFIAGVVVAGTMAALQLPFPLLWGLWVALVDFLPQVGGALAGIPTILFGLTQSLTDGIILAIVFIAYQQLENHVLNPVIMSKTVRTSPLLIVIAVLVGASIGSWIGGIFGAFVAALLAVPTAASLQILAREIWQLTAYEDADPADDARPTA